MSFGMFLGVIPGYVCFLFIPEEFRMYNYFFLFAVAFFGFNFVSLSLDLAVVSQPSCVSLHLFVLV